MMIFQLLSKIDRIRKAFSWDNTSNRIKTELGTYFESSEIRLNLFSQRFIDLTKIKERKQNEQAILNIIFQSLRKTIFFNVPSGSFVPII